MKMNTRTTVPFALFCILVAWGGTAFATEFLDLTSVTSGTAGSFSGTLNGTAVTGSLSVSTTSGVQPYYVWDDVSFTSPYPGDASVTNNMSPQYSYSNIYTPNTPLTDQIGYTQFGLTTGTATATIHFASPITNPVFDVANLDSTKYDFSSTAGLTGLLLLSGNGGAGDGLGVSGKTIVDLNPATLVPQFTNTAPLTAGARSAYGSVELLGTFTTITFDVVQANTNGDGGSFTFSTSSPAGVPDGGSTCMLMAVGIGVVFGVKIIERKCA